MSKRLQEIKNKKIHRFYEKDWNWLISEVERLRKMREIVANAHQDTLEKSQQKVERLEKALKDILNVTSLSWHDDCEQMVKIAKQALETEGKE